MKSENKLYVLMGIFVSALIASNLLGTKISYIFSQNFAVSVGIFCVPVTFLITDIVEEVYGKEKTMIFVYTGIISLIFVFLMTILAINLPSSTRYTANGAFNTVFGASLRMIIASLIAFFIAQTHDIWAFNFWKKKTKGKFLWIRNNLSTMVSQLIDTCIFMFIAFYKVAPKFTAAFIISLIIPYWLFKMLFALIDTPFVYLGVWWLKKK
jgi:queuosine precursor transporter